MQDQSVLRTCHKESAALDWFTLTVWSRCGRSAHVRRRKQRLISPSQYPTTPGLLNRRGPLRIITVYVLQTAVGDYSNLFGAWAYCGYWLRWCFE